MKQITQEELNEAIRLHGLSLKGDPEGVRLDLSNCELSRLTATGANLDGSRFVDSRFVDSRFDGSTFVGSTFVDSRFDGSTFVGSRFDGSTFVGSTFAGSRFVDSRFDGSRFDGRNGEKLIASAAMGWCGLYDYYVFAIVSDKGPWIRMGCRWRSLAEWEADFWNNPKEFPNDGSPKSNMRLAAFNYVKEWIKNNS